MRPECRQEGPNDKYLRFCPWRATQPCEHGKALNSGVSCLLVNEFAHLSVLNESSRPFEVDAGMHKPLLQYGWPVQFLGMTGQVLQSRPVITVLPGPVKRGYNPSYQEWTWAENNAAVRHS